MTGHMGSLLLMLVMLVVSVASKLPTTELPPYWNFVNGDQLEKCPDIVETMTNVNINRLLGVWFAYATTPLHMPAYRRRCASYNVQNNPYFSSKILYTDYKALTITYSCDLDPKTKLYEVKLRVLTRTRTPQLRTIKKVHFYLQTILFPEERLEYLKSDAYCFEWYILKYHQRPRPGNYRVPMNSFFEH